MEAVEAADATGGDGGHITVAWVESGSDADGDRVGDVDADGLGGSCGPCDGRPLHGAITPSQATLWPPGHTLRPVALNVASLAPQKPGVAYQITGVSIAEYSSKPGPGGGYADLYQEDDFEPDIEITGPLSVNLRAERTGKNQGRTDTIRVLATDCSGAYPFDVVVEVPHDQGQ